MRQSIVDEAEQRRGLVLGFTLAEVLLLLLFLLLLTLGAQLKELDRDKREAQSERDKIKATFAALNPLETGSITKEGVEDLALRLKEQEEKTAKLEKDKSELSAELSIFGPDPSERAKMVALTKEAAKYDPKDPPALLKRALAVIAVLGTGTKPEDVKPLPEAASKGTGKHDWPPIISLSEADGHFFMSGSAELPPDFRSILSGNAVERLLQIIKEYDVNVIEVIGHTDEQPLIERPSNLDKALQPFLQGKTPVRFVPADNAGLGFARAVAVVRVLATDSRLANLRILPLSGAQLIDVGDTLSSGKTPTAVAQRRRIEIRVRRSDKEGVTSATQDWTGNQTTRFEEPLAGTASIVDGDTITIGDARIRLWGIDAIEAEQKCTKEGKDWDCAGEATASLTARLEGQTIACQPLDRDKYGRIVATCIARNGDVGAWLVRQGLALDYSEFSGGAYDTQQALAKAEKIGIWRGDFIPPWEWRHSRQQ